MNHACLVSANTLEDLLRFSIEHWSLLPGIVPTYSILSRDRVPLYSRIPFLSNQSMWREALSLYWSPFTMSTSEFFYWSLFPISLSRPLNCHSRPTVLKSLPYLFFLSQINSSTFALSLHPPITIALYAPSNRVWSSPLLSGHFGIRRRHYGYDPIRYLSLQSSARSPMRSFSRSLFLWILSIPPALFRSCKKLILHQSKQRFLDVVHHSRPW